MKAQVGTPEAQAAAMLDGVLRQLAATRASIAREQANEALLLTVCEEIAAQQASRTSSNRSADAELPYRSVAAEIGTTLRISDRTAQRLMAEASALVKDFPATHEALESGRISRTHATVIMDAGAHIVDDEARFGFECAVLPYAERESAARLRPVAKLRAEKFAARTMTERHAVAADGRAVRVIDLPDGMADLIATLPAVLAHGALDRLTGLAHAVLRASLDDASTDEPAIEPLPAPSSPPDPGAGVEYATDPHPSRPGPDDGVHIALTTDSDARSMDQLRADILADLLLAGEPAGHAAGSSVLGEIRAHVSVTIPVLALLGSGAAPADLAGYGPIDPETARRLSGHATGWDRILTHPITGAVLAVDRYRPSEDIRRTLRVRDRHCRFPGCRLPPHRCDIDHTHDAALGGATDQTNLAHLCRRHHTLKHQTAWTVIQRPGGVLEWTSPTGRIHSDVPVSTVLFVPEPGPPPF